MMQVTYGSEPAPGGGANEDVVLAGSDYVAVLDGATAAPGVDSGCVHDVAWFARRLGAQLGRQLAGPEASAASLATLLHTAIEETMAAHGGHCDLSNPDSPSATVSMLRRRGSELDYLVLADSPILLDLVGGVRPVIDDRLDHLGDYSVAGVSRARNAPGGFWVASTVPAAAEQAVSGTVEISSVRRAAVLSDGAARLVERFAELSWARLLELLATGGPAALIARTRAAERVASERRGKRYDDATAVFVTWPSRARQP